MGGSGNMVLIVLMLMLLLAMIGAYVFTQNASDADYSGKIIGSDSNNTSAISSDFLNKSKQKVLDEGPQ